MTVLRDGRREGGALDGNLAEVEGPGTSVRDVGHPHLE